MPRLLTLAALLLLSIPAQAAEKAIARVGEKAPNFKAADVLHSRPLELKKLQGRPVVLEWNNFGCPFVQKHYSSGNMQEMQREAASMGVTWITINSSAKDKQGYLKNAGAVSEALAAVDAAPSHYVLDHSGEIGRAYGATTTPHMYVINPEGILVYAGAIDDMPTPNASDVATANNFVRGALMALAGGQPVSPAITKAYGCNVKYDF